MNGGMINFCLPSAFLFDTSGSGEILLIFAIILVLFGPRRFPELARMIGRILTRLRNASGEFKDQIMRMDARDPVGNDAQGPVETAGHDGKTIDAQEITSARDGDAAAGPDTGRGDNNGLAG